MCGEEENRFLWEQGNNHRRGSKSPRNQKDLLRFFVLGKMKFLVYVLPKFSKKSVRKRDCFQGIFSGQNHFPVLCAVNFLHRGRTPPNTPPPGSRPPPLPPRSIPPPPGPKGGGPPLYKTDLQLIMEVVQKSTWVPRTPLHILTPKNLHLRMLSWPILRGKIFIRWG